MYVARVCLEQRAQFGRPRGRLQTRSSAVSHAVDCLLDLVFGANGEPRAARRWLREGWTRRHGAGGQRRGRWAAQIRPVWPQLRRERGLSRTLISRGGYVNRYKSRSSGRHGRITGAFDGVAVRTGACGVRAVHWGQAAARGMTARPSRMALLEHDQSVARFGKRYGAPSGPDTAPSGSHGADGCTWCTNRSADASGTCRIASYGRRSAHIVSSAHSEKNACNGRLNGRLKT